MKACLVSFDCDIIMLMMSLNVLSEADFLLSISSKLFLASYFPGSGRLHIVFWTVSLRVSLYLSVYFLYVLNFESNFAYSSFYYLIKFLSYYSDFSFSETAKVKLLISILAFLIYYSSNSFIFCSLFL